MTTEITYTKGDATRPAAAGNKIIVHICNDIGAWGKGFVMAISKRWPAPEQQYRQWYKSGAGFELGQVQFVKVEPDTWVANMIGQHNIRRDQQGKPPIRYEAVFSGLEWVGPFALENNASVHMPRIGCGLAGGTWDNIGPLIDVALISNGVAVTVYDLL